MSTLEDLTSLKQIAFNLYSKLDIKCNLLNRI